MKEDAYLCVLSVTSAYSFIVYVRVNSFWQHEILFKTFAEMNSMCERVGKTAYQENVLHCMCTVSPGGSIKYVNVMMSKL